MCEVAFDFLRGSKPLKKCLEFGFQVFSKMNKGLKKMKNDLIWGWGSPKTAGFEGSVRFGFSENNWVRLKVRKT